MNFLSIQIQHSKTVTTQGWTFAGGLASTTGGRLFGFGSDQVVQVEMVLPKGQLVRFGPSKVKEKEKEFLYPTAEIISGVCCTNPHENDETKFVWKQCSRDIKFDDLWFAVLGGGGGTVCYVYVYCCIFTHIRTHIYIFFFVLLILLTQRLLPIYGYSTL